MLGWIQQPFHAFQWRRNMFLFDPKHQEISKKITEFENKLANLK